jgi:hypothetical protein
MQVGELVKVAMDAPHVEEGCPFCRPKEEVNETNTLRAHYDEDTEADNDTDNHSGTLGVNCASRPGPNADEVPDIEEGEEAPFMDMDLAGSTRRVWHDEVYTAGKIPVMYGAHHLIPGNDGLAKSDLYQGGHLGPEDNGPDPKNVGYNINSSNNGMWLPGNYAVRGKKGTRQKTWTDTPAAFQKAYAFVAMLDTKRQFHDAHKDYSDVVRRALSELADLVDEMDKDGCPACGSGSKKSDPPYHLNSRLNAVSQHLQKVLRRAPRYWKDPMFTSDWAREYKAFVAEEGGLDGARAKIEKLRKKRRHR